MRFSQKIGKTPIKTLLQVDSIDKELSNRLWNTFVDGFYNSLSDYSIGGQSLRVNACKHIWTEFFHERIDHIPTYQDGSVYCDGVLMYIDEWFFGKAEWQEIYDFLEFLSQMEDDNGKNSIGFTYACNKALAKELSGYRIIEGNVVQITTEEEIMAIEDALVMTDKFLAINTHLTTALKLLADRQSPDYRNSIKESISAVESLCKLIANDEKASFATAMAIIEKQHQLHGSLKQAYIKIYGYTSDADGIRHPLLDDGQPLEFEDAKFMLVSCSAFINYLKAKFKL